MLADAFDALLRSSRIGGITGKDIVWPDLLHICSFARGFANRHLSRAYLNGQSGNSSALPHVDHCLLADARAYALTKTSFRDLDITARAAALTMRNA